MRLKLIYIFLALPMVVFSQENSLSLEQAIATALSNNYGIIIQQKNSDISEANNTWGNTGVLPTISLNGQDSEIWSFDEGSNSHTSNYSGSVNLDWVVFRGFGARIQKATLDELEKQSNASLALVTENTIVQVTLAYYSALLQKENVLSAKEVMALSEDRYFKEKLKNELGSSNSYNLLQSQNSWLEDKANYLSSRSNYNNAIRQLNYLMAESIENQYELSSSIITDTTSFTLDTLKVKMLSNNKTLENQYINRELSRLGVRSARSAYYPTITAGANGGYSGTNSNYPDNPALNYNSDGFSSGVSAGISYSIYEGGQRKTALNVAKIQEEITQVETEQMEAELFNQLAQELELYEVRKELTHLSKEQLNAAKLNLELSTQKFETGAINSFNFRDVQQIYINATYNYLNSTYNLIESYNLLMQLTGGIIEEFE